MAAKRAFPKAKSDNVFGQARKPAKMFRAGLYARVPTDDQQTLAMQSRTMRAYAARRGWTIAIQFREVGSGAAKREARERPLGPIGNGSAGDASGTGTSRSGLRVPDRGAGSDYACGSSDGGAAGRIRSIRTGDPG